MADSIFTDIAQLQTNKLGMVNICLNAIGEIPLQVGTVLSELQAGTDGAIARDIVVKTMLEVQNTGWFFNTDKNFGLSPDSNGFIVIPSNVLRIDANKTTNKGNLIIKSGRLYNLKTQTFIFTETTYVDIVWLMDYLELPFNAWNYIAYRAATLFEKATINSPDLGRSATENEVIAHDALFREDIQYKDVNILSRVSNRMINPYLGQD
jgi:hypothetical protein